VVLRRPVVEMIALTALQLALGLAVLAGRLGMTLLPPGPALLLPTTHRITGTLIFATAVVLVLRLLRLTALRQTIVGLPESLSRVSSGRGQQVTA
ncbi:MAG: hypothetical protein ACHQIO_19240, partial [Nevskiales bacterium]